MSSPRTAVAALILAVTMLGCGADQVEEATDAGAERGPAPTGSSALGGSMGEDGQLSIPASKAEPIRLPARIDDELESQGAVGEVVIDEAEESCSFVVTVPQETLGFEKDSAVVSEDGMTFLERLAAEFIGAPEIDVVGHASSEGDEAYNQRLSEDRAAAVRAVMEQLDGYSGVEIRDSGQGESEPVAPNDTEAGREQNRRVELSGEVEREECERGGSS